MQDSDPQWKVLRCPHCDSLMKVDALNPPDSLACPSCGDTFADPDQSPLPDMAELKGGDEVIRASDLLGDQKESSGDELDLDKELGAIPEIETPSSLTASMGDVAIPARRTEEYKTPEMISNIGERGRTRTIEAAPEPKIDASRMASMDDERFAPVVDDEEGAVKEHVARKITGWDLEDEQLASSDSLIESVKRRLGIIVIGLVCVLFTCLLAYGLIKSMGGKQVEQPSVEREKIESARDALTSVERDSLDDREKLFAEGGEVIERFLNASDYKERSSLIRDPERVLPLMESYYRDNPDGPIDFRPPEEVWALSPYKSFLLGRVERKDFSTTAIAIERDSEGRFLVDWESFVGYCEIPWDKIIEKKSTTPFVVRAVGSIGDYFNYGFADGDWACVRFDSEDREHTVYGYVKLDDPVLDDMKKVMSFSGSVHVTMKIKHAGEGRAPNQFLVTEVVSKGWVFSLDGDEADSAE